MSNDQFAMRHRSPSHLIRLAFITGCVLLSCPTTAMAELSVASPFTDNAVLQQKTKVPVWGSADPGTAITVEFAGQTKDTTANSDGKWTVELNPMPASADPKTLQVSSPDSTVSFANVVVGEVWICSGQSNMQFSTAAVPEIQSLTATSENIRCFEVKRTVAMTQQDRLEGKWTEQPPNSAVAFSFAHFLEQAGDVPVGIILTCWGSSSIEAWMPREMTETVPHFQTMMEEFDADTATQDRIASILNGKKPWSRTDDIFLRRQSNILYNAMIHPLVPYACRGLVWYQGERNTQSMFGMLKDPWFSRNSGMLKYGNTLVEWIKRYRKEWGNEDMHFLIVMLPGYFKPLPTGPPKGAEHPSTHSWAWMRESQLQSLDLPHTSVVNTIDLGDVKNIHPKDKLPIGQRLAWLAARETLDQATEAEGPKMKRVDVLDDRLVVHFEHAEGLQTLDGKALSGFWLADASQKWVPADAELRGQTVILSSSELPHPLYVRYAFAGKPKVNLVNAAKLPAYPFRTDTFQP
ncbi:sialate O-acetylesterase [Rhodopirellula baltica]|uniref:Sialic acid-specific 9-O-acetylesterase n=1 Tax=Rhodopirellula baltica WH47 TaxID=991778 RepID=F2AZX8_RHOBT|nr:sialate O-acetylesterase [Rhodopirellula baltica]EGF24731.1 sialic acid-specific 9-O-acetylesterase [Rhodopirellula baltica WH47]